MEISNLDFSRLLKEARAKKELLLRKQGEELVAVHLMYIVLKKVIVKCRHIHSFKMLLTISS